MRVNMEEEDGGGNPIHKALNKKLVAMLYKALAACDGDAVSKPVMSNDDLEWRHHGPLQCQYMMQALTGRHWRREPEDQKFRFKPRRVMAFCDRVIVEGWDGLDAYWVHVGPSRWMVPTLSALSSASTSTHCLPCSSDPLVKRLGLGRVSSGCILLDIPASPAAIRLKRRQPPPDIDIALA
ncbi:hypothetical protein NL676_005782 [Syzygium grande]|nr:hypothetical protein NL676_005782 [Syzygium grande]